MKQRAASSAVNANTDKRADKEVVRSSGVADTSTVDENRQYLFMQVAASRGYPYVEKWFRQRADVMDGEAQRLDEQRTAVSSVGVSGAFDAVRAFRQKREKTIHLVIDKTDEIQHVCAAEGEFGRQWLMVFTKQAASYVAYMKKLEDMLLDRRSKADEWTLHGGRQAVLQKMERFANKREELRHRAEDEEAKELQEREAESARLQAALDNCLGEIHDVVSWHMQHQGGDSSGSQVASLRWKQLMAIMFPPTRECTNGVTAGGKGGGLRTITATPLRGNETSSEGSVARLCSSGTGGGLGGIDKVGMPNAAGAMEDWHYFPNTEEERAMLKQEKELEDLLHSHRRQRQSKLAVRQGSVQRVKKSHTPPERAVCIGTAGQARQVQVSPSPLSNQIRVEGSDIKGSGPVRVNCNPPAQAVENIPPIAESPLNRSCTVRPPPSCGTSRSISPLPSERVGSATGNRATENARCTTPSTSNSTIPKLPALLGSNGAPHAAQTGPPRRHGRPPAPSERRKLPKHTQTKKRSGHLSDGPLRLRERQISVPLPPSYGGPLGAGLSLQQLLQLVSQLNVEAAESSATTERAAAVSTGLFLRLQELKQSTTRILQENVQLQRDKSVLNMQIQRQAHDKSRIDGYQMVTRAKEELDWEILRGEQRSALADLQATLIARQEDLQRSREKVEVLARKVQKGDELLSRVQEYCRRNAAAFKRVRNATARRHSLQQYVTAATSATSPLQGEGDESPPAEDLYKTYSLSLHEVTATPSEMSVITPSLQQAIAHMEAISLSLDEHGSFVREMHRSEGRTATADDGWGTTTTTTDDSTYWATPFAAHLSPGDDWPNREGAGAPVAPVSSVDKVGGGPLVTTPSLPAEAEETSILLETDESITLLQLREPDDVAEFIYSVFEHA